MDYNLPEIAATRRVVLTGSKSIWPTKVDNEPIRAITPPNRQMSLMNEARAGASFDYEELARFIYGGQKKVQQRRAALERVETSLGTRDTTSLPRCYASTSREELYQEGLRAGRVAFEDELKYNHGCFLEATPRGTIANASPFGLVRLLFEPTIRFCGSREQQMHWLPLSRAGKILGTYCQTELGHGSFVRGVETTATYDINTDEFIVHSPTPSSTKFWPGGLGFSATHAVVMARLIVGDKDHGPNLFIVQLRSIPDGKPLPGLKLGDVGLKMAYNGTDNGFASFDHVRIPRTNMLMGHATVLRDGTYSASPGHLVLSYSTMLYGRIAVARTTGFQLAQATTIAIRYSTVREQGVPNDGSSPVEIPIMRYKSQHFRLLTLLAKSYAIVFASRKCDEDYATLRSRQETGDHAMLPYMHCLSAGLKAWATQEASDGAEDARKCCGGHGLLAISGLPEIVGSATAAATFEGENYVLWQQVGRYLVKCVDTVKSGKILPPNMAYLGHDEEPLCVTRDEELLDPEVQIAIYRQRARSLVLSVHATLRSSSKSPAEAWNECMMAIIAAARAHIEYTILLSFSTHLSTNLPATTTSALRLALERLRSLFALSHIVNPKTVDAQSFLASSPALLRAVQSGALMRLVNALLDHLLPDAIALTDAWDFTDASLCSALGMRDGDVYTHVMRWVEQLPINRKAWDSDGGVFKPGWKEDVEPVLARARL